MQTDFGAELNALADLYYGTAEPEKKPSHYFVEYEAYERYAGRGITVCDEWHRNYGAFLVWAIDNGYRNDLTIDRRDNELGYSPDNCRWATVIEQHRNYRNNWPPVPAFGEAKIPLEWCQDPRCVVSCALLYKRLVAGWSPERAITKPSQVIRRRRADPTGILA
jgi:hypothetical protein